MKLWKLPPVFWNRFPPGFSGKGIIIPPTPSLSLLRATKASPLGYPVVLLVLLESVLHKDPKQALQNITQICTFYLKPLRELIHYICSMCFPQFRRPYIIQLSPLLWPGFVRLHHLLKCFVWSDVHSVPQTYNASPGPRHLCLLPLCLECSFPNCSYDWLFLITEVLFKHQLFKNAYLPPTFSKVASLSYHYHITLLSSFCHMSLSETAYLPGICSVNANY